MGSNGIYTIEDQNDDIADLANIIPLGGSTPPESWFSRDLHISWTMRIFVSFKLFYVNGEWDSVTKKHPKKIGHV